EYNKDIDIFISQLSSYLASTGIDPVANRDQELHNIFANHDQDSIDALWDALWLR
ncbi:15299_t:CDS:2, partial [Racocetra persica]